MERIPTGRLIVAHHGSLASSNLRGCVLQGRRVRCIDEASELTLDARDMVRPDFVDLFDAGRRDRDIDPTVVLGRSLPSDETGRFERSTRRVMPLYLTSLVNRPHRPFVRTLSSLPRPRSSVDRAAAF